MHLHDNGLYAFINAFIRMEKVKKVMFCPYNINLLSVNWQIRIAQGSLVSRMFTMPMWEGPKLLLWQKIIV